MGLEQLENTVGLYGSKIAVPMMLQETPCAKYCMEYVTIRPGEICTADQFQTILKLCEKYEACDVLVRVTHPSDWKGAIDVFETIRCDAEDKASVQEAIAKARSRAQEPWVQQYIDAEHAQRKESRQYNPDDIFIQIVPVLSDKGGLLTEHPHFTNVQFADVTEEESFDYTLIEPHTVVGENIFADVYEGRNAEDENKGKIQHMLKMIHSVRVALGLDINTAYQFEIGLADDRIFLHQIREFARCSAQRILAMETTDTQAFKLFGTFNGMAQVCRGNRANMTFRGEGSNNPYILAPKSTSEQGLEDDQVFPGHMVGFVPELPSAVVKARKASFVHENTRFAQAALRNGGFVDLRRNNGFDSLQDKSMTHVVCENGNVRYSAAE